MSHMKAEVVTFECCIDKLLYPHRAKCDPTDMDHLYCDRINDGWTMTNGANCGHAMLLKSFIERDYKRLTAEPHDGTYDGFFGCYDVTAGGHTYLCTYLDIDGRVYCDESSEFESIDPRIDTRGVEVDG